MTPPSDTRNVDSRRNANLRFVLGSAFALLVLAGFILGIRLAA